MTLSRSDRVLEFTEDRGWRMVVAAGIGYGLGLTVLPFHTLGVFVLPLETAFGWSRAEVQASLIWLTAATLVGAWFVGWMTDRLGVRKVALVSQFGLATGFCLLAVNPGSLWFWYVSWLLMALLGLGTSPITWTRGIAGWFDAARGMALALALTGSGVVALAAPATVAFLIERIGWRMSYIALAVAVLLIAIPSTYWLFPKQDTRFGRRPQRMAASDPAAFTLQAALSSYRFWLILAGAMAASFVIGGLLPNLVPMLIDQGLHGTTASALAGILGLTMIVGRLVTGYALDRFWAPAIACSVLPWSALACFILAQDVADYFLIALLVALLGLAAGAEFDLLPYLCTRYFGTDCYGRVFALQWVGVTVAAGLAPAVFGHSYDVTGSYAPILHAGSVLFLFAALVLLPLGRYPRWPGGCPATTTPSHSVGIALRRQSLRTSSSADHEPQHSLIQGLDSSPKEC